MKNNIIYIGDPDAFSYIEDIISGGSIPCIPPNSSLIRAKSYEDAEAHITQGATFVIIEDKSPNGEGKFFLESCRGTFTLDIIQHHFKQDGSSGGLINLLPEDTIVSRPQHANRRYLRHTLN